MAVVDDAGLVTAVGAGEAEVTATAAGITGRAELMIVAPAPTAIAVTPDTVALTALGQTTQLAAEVRDQIGRVMEGEPVAWSSADTAVAPVDSIGLVTAVANGTVTITATAGEASGEALVTVMQSAGSVVVSPRADTVALGGTLRLAAEALDSNGHAVAGAEFRWSSSDPGVATVDDSGLVRGQAEGKATITAAAGGVEGTSEITVANPDRAALVALYHATDGPNWVDNGNWLTEVPLDEWYGISTDGAGRVTTIELAANALAGPLPPEIGRLANLRRLELSRNGLTGSIPSEIGRLPNLEFLNLPINNLTGPLPPELGRLMNLRWLQLATNALEGPIPPEWVGLTKLRSLYIFNNDLTGPLPQSLLELKDLNALSFGFNAGLCAPGTVDFVNWLNGRQFTNGPFCNDSDRAVLRALFEDTGGTGWTDSGGWLGSAATDGWHGVRADSLGRVTALNLDNNRLVGRLPPNLGDLTQMTELQIEATPTLTAVCRSLWRVSPYVSFAMWEQRSAPRSR